MIDVSSTGSLESDLGQYGHVPPRITLPVVDCLEDLVERLGQGPVKRHGHVGGSPICILNWSRSLR